MPDEPHNTALQPGDRMDEYVIQAMLGKGGMGEVYLAEHSVMHKLYALKVLPKQLSASPHFISRFKIEARVMADLEHPNIVRVHHLGHVDDRYFLTMDYVDHGDGHPRTLEEEIREKGTIPEKDAVKYALQMCHALDYAHKFRGEGVIHRDLKPANVLLGPNNSIKIADFGIAKIVGAEYLHSMLERSIGVTRMAYLEEVETVVGDDLSNGPATSEGSTVRAIIGTYDYMSPEQKEGRPASPQSDIFAMGVILYRMITGRKPEGIWEMPSASGANKAWDMIIGRCMQREPKDRYYSVNDLADALGGINAKVGYGVGTKLPFLKMTGILALITAGGVGGLIALEYLSQKEKSDPDTGHDIVVKMDSPPPHIGDAPVIDPAPVPPAEITPAVAPLATVKIREESTRKPAVDVQEKTVAEDARVQAQLARESLQAQNVDPAHGFQALLNMLEMDWKAAERELAGEDFKLAENKYLEIIDQVGYIEELDVKRREIVSLENELAALRLEAASIGAERTAMDVFREANQLETYSSNSLKEAKFDEATKGFALARESYQKAMDIARDAHDYQKQVDAFEKVKTLAGVSGINMIKKFESEKYSSIEQFVSIGNDSGKSYVERSDSYEKALSLFEKALLGAREAYQAEQAMLAKKSSGEKVALELEQAEQDGLVTPGRQHAEEEQQRLASLKASRIPENKSPVPESIKPSISTVSISQFDERRTAELLELPLGDSVSISLRRLGGGHFIMGKNVRRLFGKSDESPEHPVEITDRFWMGIHEVTQQQYLAVAGKNPSRVKGADLPVETVTWQDAMSFCEQLNQKVADYLGTDLYTVRLPTEAEWEYACRGGTRTAYHSGDDEKTLKSVAWCALNSEKKTHAVGTLAPNPFGLFDMHGNVWELCYDYYEASYYANSVRENPMGPVEGKLRVARGGSFEEVEHCRSANRWPVKERGAASYIGFRIVITGNR